MAKTITYKEISTNLSDIVDKINSRDRSQGRSRGIGTAGPKRNKQYELGGKFKNRFYVNIGFTSTSFHFNIKGTSSKSTYKCFR